MTTDPNTALSYYAASANPAPEHPQLQGDVTADVCVIGGGIAGCSTALDLAERGYKVVLLEGQRIGWGASGRSGGQAISGYASGQSKLVDQVGAENAKRMWDISLEGLQLIRDRVAKYNIDCDLHWGQMHVAIKPRQRDTLLHEKREAEETYGYRQLEFLERGPSRSVAGNQALLRRPVRQRRRTFASVELHTGPRRGGERRRCCHL